MNWKSDDWCSHRSRRGHRDHEGKKIAMRKGRPETFTLCRFHPGTSKHILLRKADVQECK